tara:strand:- start:146 stop:388 length:243 start_codon:yes stop_codon:yes gene_type:complete
VPQNSIIRFVNSLSVAISCVNGLLGAGGNFGIFLWDHIRATIDEEIDPFISPKQMVAQELNSCSTPKQTGSQESDSQLYG